METWFTNIGAGVTVLLIGLATRVAREAWSGRRGKLAGWWLWITYAPADHTKSQAIWSIEACHIAHRPGRRSETVTGTVWRIFDRHSPPHYKRQWKFEGAYVNDVVEGRYSWSRDEGGSHGVFHVWETHPMVFEGKFVRVIKTGSGGTLTHEREEAWTEWARLPAAPRGSLETALAAIPLSDAVDCYPWRLRRRLAVGGGPLQRWAKSLAAGAAFVDNRPLLEQIRSERVAEARPEPLTLYRSDLGIFPEPLRTAPPEDDLPLAG